MKADFLKRRRLSPTASVPGISKQSKLFFRLFPSDELEGRRAGRFLREEQDASTVLIFAEDSDPSHYIGVAPAPGIDVEKSTNGQDADAPPGPSIVITGMSFVFMLFSDWG